MPRSATTRRYGLARVETRKKHLVLRFGARVLLNVDGDGDRHPLRHNGRRHANVVNLCPNTITLLL